VQCRTARPPEARPVPRAGGWRSGRRAKTGCGRHEPMAAAVARRAALHAQRRLCSASAMPLRVSPCTDRAGDQRTQQPMRSGAHAFAPAPILGRRD
jgi:hypothetical protein